MSNYITITTPLWWIIKKESVELNSFIKNGGCGKTRIKQTIQCPTLSKK